MGTEIINIAIKNLRETTGIKAQWDQNGPLDGLFDIDVDGKQLEFVAEIKKELRQHQIHHLLHLYNEYENLIIIAQNIFPKIKEELRKIGIAYLETNGNLFLKRNGIHYFIDTNKKIVTKKETANRAFTKTGLKVVFHLLLDKELINQTQREIAERVNVGLGNIPQVINGLKEIGYLIPLNNKTYVWENRDELLNRWINAYATELRPKINKGNYTFHGDWKELKMNNEKTVWGGEPAADILTDYLRPEKFIIYTKEDQVNLMKNYRLIPKDDGEVEVLEVFWNITDDKETAPPILVYADLMLEGGKRNKETALKIFNEYIEPNL